MYYPSFTRTLSLALTLAASSLCAQEAEIVAETDGPSNEQRAPQKYQRAQDLAYGATLYEYFQGNYFDALSTLLVAQQQDSIQIHRDNAALIEGGISLGFGLHNRAAELFEQQTNAEAVPKYRRTAWLKLAELNYLNGDFINAAAHLEKSGVAEESSLPLNLALRNKDLTTAKKLLESSDLFPAEKVLGHINLGAAFARSSQLPAAIHEYQVAVDFAETIDIPSTEIPILLDKAHIGMGYALALSEQHTEAKQAFSRVRLNTPWATRALLGMAWSSINGEDYQAGIDALQFLLDKHRYSPAAREAMVALPYGYEKLENRSVALSAYRNAEAYYLKTLTELQQLQQDLTTEPLAYDPVQREAWRYGWLQLAQASPLLRDNQHFLRPILQSDRFQLRLTELRDLQQLTQVLQSWQDKLPLFTDLIEERHLRRTTIIDHYNSAQFDQQLQMAKQQYDHLRAALEQIERERDALTLLATTATPDDQSETLELLEILTGAQERLKKIQGSGKASQQQAETLAKARGILLWQASEQYHDKLWQQRKSLQQLEDQLRSGREQRKKTDTEAQRGPQLRQLAYRVVTAGDKIPAQQAAIVRASELIEADLRREVIAQLGREQQQIHNYMAHTRLAIARLQDAEMQAIPAASQADSDTDNTGAADHE
ncbi:hypothetical protein BTJ40_20680 [Microbulbifer sp. A4B17]|uniref:hypothetical protein n=1 Tax=Microbulbifer sp. A4B17 TaxID=359370 RepID=UPI000D52D4F5|nr:hypothetical protein [Microbulbifer sp. A4B17]AWF83038.1 hypothetical protein BTJ40_20680 [Microbulbifer sp. A4B17]